MKKNKTDYKTSADIIAKKPISEIDKNDRAMIQLNLTQKSTQFVVFKLSFNTLIQITGAIDTLIWLFKEAEHIFYYLFKIHSVSLIESADKCRCSTASHKDNSA